MEIGIAHAARPPHSSLACSKRLAYRPCHITAIGSTSLKRTRYFTRAISGLGASASPAKYPPFFRLGA